MGQTITYHFTLNSPWSYLGDARLAKMAARHGATVVHKPTNFGLVFPETGGLPLPKRAPARQAYRLQELERWPAHLGIPLIKQPDNFPSNERNGIGIVIAAINQGTSNTNDNVPAKSSQKKNEHLRKRLIVGNGIAIV